MVITHVVRIYIRITVLNSNYFQKLLNLWLSSITLGKNKTEEKILKIIVVITIASMIAKKQNFFPANAVLI